MSPALYALQLGEVAAILSLRAPVVTYRNSAPGFFRYCRDLRDALGGQRLGVEGNCGHMVTLEISPEELARGYRLASELEEFRELLEPCLGRLWALVGLIPAEGWS